MKKYNWILLCLGSNVNKFRNMALAMERLSEYFYPVYFSGIYETEPLGKNAGTTQYLNQLVIAYTDMELLDVQLLLKKIECDIGRLPEHKIKNIVYIDIDLLKWNEIIIKEIDIYKGYVQKGIQLFLQQLNIKKSENTNPAFPENFIQQFKK